MYNIRLELTPLTLNSCSDVQIILIVEDMSFHIVKTVFKYSFWKRTYGLLKMCIAHCLKIPNFNSILT